MRLVYDPALRPTNRSYFADDMHAVVLGDSPVRLWGLTPAERIQRQLRSEDIDLWRGGLEALPANETILVLRGDCLYDARVIRGLAKARQAMLEVDAGGGLLPVAAHVTAEQARSVGELLRSGSPRVPTAGVATVTIEQLAGGFEAGLLKADRPYVLPVTAESRNALERLAFSGAYKGVTDLVTKWLWPRPAQWATRGCVRMGITPNQVTAASLVLVIAAGVLFARGEYGWGLLAGWIMTFLDTVDGKLARVTVTSTQLGNVFDHGIDLVHPPLWYIAWGVGLARDPAVIAGVTLPTLYLVILAGYVGGRLCEGAFQRWIAPFPIYTWRPFDSWFRLIVARRNPNLIMLTVSLAAGRPDLGLVAVAAWTALSTAILLVRLLQSLHAKRCRDPLGSWLAEIGQTVDEGTLAVRVFTHAPSAVRKG
jgi:phosphatidylglycerophosphate synthase